MHCCRKQRLYYFSDFLVSSLYPAHTGFETFMGDNNLGIKSSVFGKLIIKVDDSNLSFRFSGITNLKSNKKFGYASLF